ncbi:hypothetical protein EDD11_004168 [Mortierella claussenii]|nr:hypothetical protein EDD11_004168 [Mortierella claussenii]
MDPAEMSEEQARDTVSKMFDEMTRTMNAIGDYSESEEETDTDDDRQAPSHPTTINPEAMNSATEDEPKKKKKKKRKKKKAADKPDLEDLLSNADTLEPEDPFDPSKSAAERVELAVARFRKNRKFSSERAQILSVYLDYGGIKTGPKSFQGGGAAKTPGVTDNDDNNPGEPDYEAMNVGIDLVDLPEDGQEVDFTNVVTTFLSQYFLKSTGWIDMVYYRDAPLVVAALLNYFLIRNVVPEYEADVRAALAVAEQAKIELPLCKMISNGWPSRYDKACSLIYGGEFFGFLDESWQEHEILVETLGMDREMAERIVQSVVGPDIDLTTLTVAPREFMELEVVQLDIPKELVAGSEEDEVEGTETSDIAAEDEAELVAMVDKMLLGQGGQGFSPDTAMHIDGEKASMLEVAPQKPLLPVPAFADVTFAQLDPELPREQQKPVDQRRKIHVYFDPSMATKMLLGMRVTAYVWTLSNGMSYLQQASVYPTYYLEADEIEVPEDEWDD